MFLFAQEWGGATAVCFISLCVCSLAGSVAWLRDTCRPGGAFYACYIHKTVFFLFWLLHRTGWGHASFEDVAGVDSLSM